MTMRVGYAHVVIGAGIMQLRQRPDRMRHWPLNTRLIIQIGPRKSMRKVEREIPKRVDWYTNRRLLGPIGYITPLQKQRRRSGQT